MERIRHWPDFILRAGPFLAAARPVEAMERIGLLADGDVAAALVRGQPPQPFPPDLVSNLTAAYGPPPPMRVFVGRVPPPDLPPTAPESGYNLIASAQLSVLNDVLAELWHVGTIAHQLSEERTQQVINLPRLRQTCTGVPADAVLGVLQFAGPPVAVAGTASLTIRFDIPWLLPVVATTPATFAGTATIEVPLDLVVRADRVRLSLDAIYGASASLHISPLVDIQPKSQQDKETLDGWVSSAVWTALLYQSWDANGFLSVPASLPIAKSRYPNSILKLVEAGATTVRSSNQDFAVVGLNVQNPRTPIFPGQLGNAALPGTSLNLHTVVSQEFANDALSAIIASGDLAAFFNRVLARNAHGFRLSEVRVDSGKVSFHDGQLRMSMDLVAVDACVAHKDLAFTASLTGTPSVAGGKLTITTSELDFDLDNWDAFVCTLLGGFLGPFGIVITVAVLAIIAAINPTVSDLDIPVSETSDPLPGSDKVVQVGLTEAAMTTGRLTADGRVSLVSDPLHVFAYLRVVAMSGPLMFPVAGATVDLFELDNPAPAGDDVTVPRTGTFDTITPQFLTTDEITYTPNADEHLGTETTDEDGRVTFVVVSNMVGGTKTRHRTVTDIRTDHRVSSTTSDIAVGEALPDLAVTITSSAGRILATRRLVGLNVTNRRLGTFDHPVILRVAVPLPDINDPTSDFDR